MSPISGDGAVLDMASPDAADDRLEEGIEASQITKLNDIIDERPPENSGNKESFSVAESMAMMEENRQLLAIKSAQVSLANYRDFRSQTEKGYFEKLSALENEKADPLQQARIEIDLLNKKLQRRDEIIRALRRSVLEDVVLSKQGDIEDLLARMSESFQVEEEKILRLTDECLSLQMAVTFLEEEATDFQQRLEAALQREKQLLLEANNQEIILIDKIKEMDRDKHQLQTIVASKEEAVERLSVELEKVVSEMKEINKGADDKGGLINSLKRENEMLNKQLLEERRERKAAVASLEDAENAATESIEAISQLTEANEDLSTRYESLINELDRMVEEGYYLPPEDENVPLGYQKSRKRVGRGYGNNMASTKNFTLYNSSARLHKASKTNLKISNYNTSRHGTGGVGARQNTGSTAHLLGNVGVRQNKGSTTQLLGNGNRQVPSVNNNAKRKWSFNKKNQGSRVRIANMGSGEDSRGSNSILSQMSSTSIESGRSSNGRRSSIKVGGGGGTLSPTKSPLFNESTKKKK